MLSFSLLRFEIHVREDSVFGILGADGSGLALSDCICVNNCDEAAFILLMLSAAVAIIHGGSRPLRLTLVRT